MTTEEIINTIALIGLGGIFKSIYDSYSENKKKINEKRHQFKEPRYKAILLLLYALLYYDKQAEKLKRHRPDIQSKEDLIDEVKVECANMILFASDEVILAMKDFIKDVNSNNYTKTALAIRKDLYELKTKLTPQNINPDAIQ